MSAKGGLGPRGLCGHPTFVILAWSQARLPMFQVVLLNPDLYPRSLTLSVEICLYLSGPSVSSRLAVFFVGSTYRGPRRRVGWGGWDAGAPNGGQSSGSRMLEFQKSDKA